MEVLSKFEKLTCFIALLSSTIILFVNIVLRFIFKSGLPWAEELVRYLILVITFIGLGAGINNKQDISMDFLLQISKANIRKKLEIIKYLVSSIFSLILAVISFQFAMQTKINGQITSALQLPFYILYLIISFGSVLTALRYIEGLILHIKELKSVN